MSLINDDGKVHGGRILKRVVLPIIGIILVIGIIWWGVGMLSQPARVLERTFDADNMIANYEWFKQTHQDYLATQNQIVIAKNKCTQFKSDAGDRNTWSFEDKTEYSRLNSVVQGLENHVLSLVSTYNARSAMMNRNLFKSKDLPYKLGEGE